MRGQRVKEQFEVVIIGAGIAGVSLAYALARRGMTDVVVVERESAPAYHASGRSAQTLLELDPHPVVQRLKMLGAALLRDPPTELTTEPLLARAGAMRLYRGEQWQALHRRAAALVADGLGLELLTPREAAAKVEVLDPGELDGAAYLPDCGFIDVDRLIRCYVDGARRLGVELRFGLEVRAVDCSTDGPGRVDAGGQTLAGRWIVNAAGAWAGALGRLARATPIELVPLRRSLAILSVPETVPIAGWPLVWSDSHRVYFRPDARGLLLCPMDEAPSEPCDAQPPGDVVAQALRRLARLAPGLATTGTLRSWAGLRTFAPDGAPVVGGDPALPSFFWLAGQGGCGIETSPLLGELAADLLCEGATDRFDAALLAPARFPG